MREFMQKHKKITMVLLSLLICVTVFTTTTEKANANPIIIAAGTAILAGMLVNMGYSYLTANDVNNAYNGLPSTAQSQLESIGMSYSISYNDDDPLGLAQINISQTLWNDMLEFFGQGEISSNLNFDSVPYMSSGDPRQEFVRPIYEALALSYASVVWTSNNDNGHFCKSNLLVSDGNIIANQNEVGDIFFSSDGTNYEQRPGYEWTWDGLQAGTLTATGSNTWQNNYIQSSHNWNNVNLCETNTAIPVYVAGVLTGFLGEGTNGTSYVWNEGYNQPVSADVNIKIPVNDSPDTNTSYNGESISLDTVIAGYGSMQAYFDAGGVITLGDGTVLSGSTGVNDISNSDVQALQDAVLGQMTIWEKIQAKIGEIGNTLSGGISGVLGGISSTLSGINEWGNTASLTITGAITGVWDWLKEFGKVDFDDWELDFDAFKDVPLADKFPFCIPFDFYNCISVWSASPEAYQLHVDFDTEFLDIHKTIDVSPFQMVFQFFRGFCIIFFTYILIVKTSSLIRW